MGNHRTVALEEPTTKLQHRAVAMRNAKALSLMTTGLAMPVAALFAFSYATDSHLAGISPMAATSIFIDGTKDIIPTNDPQAADRMRQALGGAYDLEDGVGPAGNNVYINPPDYPRSFGVLTGLSDPGYDESKAMGAEALYNAIKTANAQNPGDPIYVVGFSQGSNAASDVIKRLEEEDPTFNASNVTFVLLGNGARNDGGLWARLPAGVYVPLIGLSFGASMNPAAPSYAADAPQVIQISKQYDGASDVPKYVMNPVAWANAAMGFLYVHNGYYKDVDISDLDTNGDGRISDDEIAAQQLEDPDKYIITKNGNITDIVIRNEVGDLPLTQPLLAMGVPRELVEALDPLLRAIIETGYDRPVDGGTYPAEPVHLQLMPGPSRWIADFKAIAAGMKETEENLDNLNQSNLMQAGAVEESAGADAMVAPPASPAPSTPPAQRWTPTEPSTHTTNPTFAPLQVTPTPTWAPPPAPTPTPPVQLNTTGVGDEVPTADPAPTPRKFIPGIPKAIQGAIGTVKEVAGAFIPKRKTTPTSGPSTPASEPEPANGPEQDAPTDTDTDAGSDTPPS